MSDLDSLSPLLDTASVAAILKISPATVRRWVLEGRLPALRLAGRTVRFRPADIERVLERSNILVGQDDAHVA